jgi:hypothetical protein
VIKTNDTNISLQINFNVNLHNGIIEYDENKFRYFVSNNDNNFEISKHLIFKKKKIILTLINKKVQSIDFQNKYAFPISIHSIKMNKYTQKYFEVIIKRI